MTFDQGQEWLAIKNNGYYDGSLQARQKPIWHLPPEELHSLHAPDEYPDLYKPGLLQSLFVKQ